MPAETELIDLAIAAAKALGAGGHRRLADFQRSTGMENQAQANERLAEALEQKGYP